MAGNAIYERMKSNLGNATTPVTYDVEKGHVRHFAEAIGDPNPLWRDEIYSRNTPHGGISVPPTFTRAFIPSDEDESQPRDSEERVLDAGSEYEYFAPIKIGDKITVVSKIAEVFQKDGRLGPMTFQVKEVSFTNQFGQVVATRRDTGIYY